MKSDKEYQDSINNVEDFLEFHPETLKSLSPEEQEALSRYYFAGRGVDVEDVFEYRKKLLSTDPGLEPKADAAYAKLLA